MKNIILAKISAGHDGYFVIFNLPRQNHVKIRLCRKQHNGEPVLVTFTNFTSNSNEVGVVKKIGFFQNEVNCDTTLS